MHAFSEASHRTASCCYWQPCLQDFLHILEAVFKEEEEKDWSHLLLLLPGHQSRAFAAILFLLGSLPFLLPLSSSAMHCSELMGGWGWGSVIGESCSPQNNKKSGVANQVLPKPSSKVFFKVTPNSQNSRPNETYPYMQTTWSAVWDLWKLNKS